MYRNIAFVKKCNNKMYRYMNMHKNISLYIYIHTHKQTNLHNIYHIFCMSDIYVALLVMSKKISLAIKEKTDIKRLISVDFPERFID